MWLGNIAKLMSDRPLTRRASIGTRNHVIMEATQENPQATAQDQLVSTAELSRLLNFPVLRVKKAFLAGAITPAQVCLDGRLHLWRLGDLPTIRARIVEAVPVI